jgi:hypothetical protein
MDDNIAKIVFYDEYRIANPIQAGGAIHALSSVMDYELDVKACPPEYIKFCGSLVSTGALAPALSEAELNRVIEEGAKKFAGETWAGSFVLGDNLSFSVLDLRQRLINVYKKNHDEEDKKVQELDAIIGMGKLRVGCVALACHGNHFFAKLMTALYADVGVTHYRSTQAYRVRFFLELNYLSATFKGY